jgi:peptidoglycan/xylan/chitin deacetylase (PgdA/CDA1 family)
MPRLIRLVVLLAALLRVAGATALAQQLPVAVLAYHRFDPVRSTAATVVTTTMLDEQLGYLADHHVAVVPLDAVVAAMTQHGLPILPAPAVAITVDDGFRSVYDELYPRIQRLHMPITLFINPPMISGGHAYLTWEQIAEMRRSGLVDVEPHTMTHPDFRVQRARLSPEAFHALVEHELGESRRLVQERLGVAADILAWPYGIHDPELEQAARDAGYVATFALESRVVAPGDNAFALPRYQIYESDDAGRMAAIIAGVPRRKARHAP